MRLINISILLLAISSCSSNKKVQAQTGLPPCLESKIKSMADDSSEGSQLSLKSFSYKQQTVYYMVSPCCDKFNIVYDSACNVLGRPDGGFTGKGDGTMKDFRKEATNEKIVWVKK